MRFSVNSGGDDSGRQEKLKMIHDILETETERMLASVNSKIFRLPNMYVTKLYFLQSTEMILNKITIFVNLSMKGTLGQDELYEALSGEFYRQAIIIYHINAGKIIDDRKVPAGDKMIIDQIETYLNRQQMDLAESLHSL